MVVFDLDGCLIDSEPIIRDAYRDTGHDPPPGFMALGHHDWIPGEPSYRARVHAAKDAAYLHRLAAGPVTFLDPWLAAVMLDDAGTSTALLTGAPPGTLLALAEHAPSWPFVTAMDGLDPAAKTAWLKATAPAGTLVDDQVYVTAPPGWRRIHWTGQPAHELCRLVTCP